MDAILKQFQNWDEHVPCAGILPELESLNEFVTATQLTHVSITHLLGDEPSEAAGFSQVFTYVIADKVENRVSGLVLIEPQVE